jgi:nucleoid-associated protein YgaU
MSATLPAEADACKHMFGTALDSERTFEQHGKMQRTYVRRRLAVLAASVTMVLALSGAIARAVGTTSDVDLVSSRTYVVRPGDTLWSIASWVAPRRDPRQVVAELQRLNGRSTRWLTPGQVLSIPARA